ncbi:MAG: flagellar biosynthetic protein FliO [Pseudomonadota bacterium]
MLIKRYMAGLWMLLATKSVSAQTTAQVIPTAASASTNLVSLVLNLVLVLAIIAVSAWLLSRGRQHLGGDAGALRVVASKAIGHRERLLVIDIGGEQVLVGVTSQSINHLHTLAEPLASSVTSPVTDASFASRLQRLLPLGQGKDST